VRRVRRYRRHIFAVAAAVAIAGSAGYAGTRYQGSTGGQSGPDYPPAGIGVADPNVTQSNLQQTICVSGYSGTVRPSSSFTGGIKAKLLAVQGGSSADYELDHEIAIEIGGAPADPNNLWLEHWNGTYGAHKKDHLENALHKAVCSGGMTLADAQACIRDDWISCYKQQGLP
jgi:hypothetical protein